MKMPEDTSAKVSSKNIYTLQILNFSTNPPVKFEYPAMTPSKTCSIGIGKKKKIIPSSVPVYVYMKIVKPLNH